MPPTSTPLSPGFKRVELAAILLALGLACLYAPRLRDVGWVNLPIALGMLVFADFLSGVTHWGFDRWGSVTTPLIGPNLIRGFREHHTDQLGITRHTFVEANGGPAIGAIPIFLVGLAASGVVSVAFFWLGAFGFVTNVVHSWAHGDAPRLVRWMQRTGILLSPEHHAAHHEAPHDRAYCITTGWLNPVLDRFDVWGRMERALTAVIGVAPFHG